MKPAKPPHGQPCNNCGRCCDDQRCPSGVALFGPGSRCPALTDGQCGLILDPLKYAHGDADALRSAASVLVGAGLGCDALLLGETPDPTFYRKVQSWLARNRPTARRALRLWQRANRRRRGTR